MNEKQTPAAPAAVAAKKKKILRHKVVLTIDTRMDKGGSVQEFIDSVVENVAEYEFEKFNAAYDPQSSISTRRED